MALERALSRSRSFALFLIVSRFRVVFSGDAARASVLPPRRAEQTPINQVQPLERRRRFRDVVAHGQPRRRAAGL